MGILTWIIFGLIAGAIAKLIMPGNQGMGWLMTIILGIVGAFVGGWIGSMLGWGTVNDFDFKSMLLAVVGALLVLWIYGMVTKKA
ncbi:GlsB/YeaQ/YmgE family stress response membrane protein [Chryseobacterium manosquense]|uniref:GlsB/YeaQ/YmgE family stress response membrane protein n=2 Tax=Chryseobacterium group TaxID=2782232 RepID=A0A246BCM6_9FLAO|nr:MULTISPECIES: GlsB/YeaQ/YmgE family stress response membrane protein [Chryseobacterium group]AZB20850.1 GlsB/YeaQ/YmgE family stress response membrane protein [Kaistella haifensis]MDN5577752.1 GlsB/YeaQ/YmgE family stress response membrane protein [Chryseobacterium sp.]OWK99430.1 GlsB/YeaQ/YmgE family stress response membrane protein [Kaistella haifensis DSM 19056]QNS40402.1 GlsB/YeaQ/YmgE family stress response membrane protein [Chryseobacterium manosquense]